MKASLCVTRGFSCVLPQLVTFPLRPGREKILEIKIKNSSDYSDKGKVLIL